MSKLNFERKDNIIRVKNGDSFHETELSDYEVIDEIGKGANGIVLKCKHNITDRDVAVKIWLPHPKSSDSRVNTEQYLKEVRKVAKLKHESIVTIFDAKVVDGNIHICVMEYIDAKPLSSWKDININSNINVRLSVCKKILETVTFFHEQGILHGDFHDNNVLIDSENNVYVIDFGTSRPDKISYTSLRESYMVYDLINSILKDVLDPNFFHFKKYQLYGKIIKDNDVRKYTPQLVAKTLLSAVDMLMIRQAASSLANLEALYDYSVSLFKGTYLKTNYILNSIISELKEENHELAIRTINDAAEDVLTNFGNYENHEIVMVESTLAYWKILSNDMPRIDINELWEFIIKYKVRNKDEYIRDYNIIVQYMDDGVHELIYELAKEYDNDYDTGMSFLREILFDILCFLNGNSISFVSLAIKLIHKFKYDKAIQVELDKIIELVESNDPPYTIVLDDCIDLS